MIPNRLGDLSLTLRCLISLTLGSLLRVISARPISRKERRVYAQTQEA